jgi:N-dimethylarginine dimethylaminohydrolase
MRLLMCAPLYFGVGCDNESRTRESDPQLAKDQWTKLYRLLQARVPIEINLVEPTPRLPDMVFASNAGLVWQNKYISSNFRREIRRGESPRFESWFLVRGFEIHHIPEGTFFEGEGDLLPCGDLVFAGYHLRSDVIAHQKVSEIIQREVLSLELANEWSYALDTCFCPLSENLALFYPGAFTPDALGLLEVRFSTLIPVQEEEARRFACNSIVIGKTVIMNDECPVVRSQLVELGFTVCETPLSEYTKAGGSAKCLTLRVPQ